MIYDLKKEKIITNPDLTKGYLDDDVLVINHQAIPGIEEVGHYEVIAEYPDTNGKEIAWVVDVPAVKGQEAYTEEIPIKVYVPYTEKELKYIEMNNLLEYYKSCLELTNSLVLEYVEGLITEDVFNAIKEERKTYRKKISELEEKLLEIVE